MADPISIVLMEIEMRKVRKRLARFEQMGVSAGTIRRIIENEEKAGNRQLLRRWLKQMPYKF